MSLTALLLLPRAVGENTMNAKSMLRGMGGGGGRGSCTALKTCIFHFTKLAFLAFTVSHKLPFHFTETYFYSFTA